MGVPSSARTPPCVLNSNTSVPPSFAGSQPMPASCVSPKRSPEGRFSSISAVMGNAPFGPWPVLRRLKSDESPESVIDARSKEAAMNIPSMIESATLMATSRQAPVGDRYVLQTGEAGHRRLILLHNVYGPTTERL